MNTDMDPQGEGHVEKEAEMGMVCPQARKHLEPQEAGRGRKEAPLEVLERARPCRPSDRRLVSLYNC